MRYLIAPLGFLLVTALVVLVVAMFVVNAAFPDAGTPELDPPRP